MNIPHRILTPDEDNTFSKTLESDSSTEFVTAQNSLADVSTAYVQYFTLVCSVNSMGPGLVSWDSSKFSNFRFFCNGGIHQVFRNVFKINSYTYP